MKRCPGVCANIACLWEASARKAGNVHRSRDFAGLSYTDFLLSAAAIAPVLGRARRQSVGQTVLQAIEATRSVVATNTNLGMVLLLAPLAAVPEAQTFADGIRNILTSLTVEDSQQVFAAIRLAKPGGLGKVSAEDVTGEPTLPLRSVMALAADRDLIAAQYANDFHDILRFGLPALQQALSRFGNVEEAIVFTHLHFLARFRDSLILRKRGAEEAAEASIMAAAVLEAGWPESLEGQNAFAAFDGWLTAAGNGRNPGTSADLVTACLFAALRDDVMGTPFLPFTR